MIGLRRAMIADRPAPWLLRRIRAIRADLRSVERRLVLDHARRSVEEALPGDRHAGTRRALLELLESYPHGRGVDRV
jgi:DNA-binding FrmR family transcriptional regulator